LAVDLAYFRAHPEQVRTFLVHQRIRETPVGGGSICQALRLTLEDGTSLFAKFLNDPTDPSASQPVPEGFFEAEADGLRWLGVAGGAPVPEVYAGLPGLLLLEWIEPGQPTSAAARRFGRELAATHRAGADGFGAPWPGYIGTLAQPNVGGPTWPEWFVEQRLRPHLRAAADNGALGAPDVTLLERVFTDIERFAPPPEQPSRLHGDLWHGNLLWGADGRVRLIDPSAHGGHRETDLANLLLFGGAPHAQEVLEGYAEVWPLADGWRARVALHQLHLLLVHAVLFGGRYRSAVVAAASSLVRRKAPGGRSRGGRSGV
jgi:fructosamine-3-kinase